MQNGIIISPRWQPVIVPETVSIYRRNEVVAVQHECSALDEELHKAPKDEIEREKFNGD